MSISGCHKCWQRSQETDKNEYSNKDTPPNNTTNLQKENILGPSKIIVQIYNKKADQFLYNNSNCLCKFQKYASFSVVKECIIR